MLPRGRPGKSRSPSARSRIAGLGLALLAAIAIVGISPAPASAANFTNASIADQGLARVGQSGGQCKQFANDMVWAASSGTVGIGGGYYAPFSNAGGTRVSASAAVKGDIIQLNKATDRETYYTGMHTAIVVSYQGSNTFDVVDSNWGTPLNNEIVKHHTWNPFTTASQYGLEVNIWRLGNVSADGGTSSNASRSDVDNNSASDLVLTTASPGGGSAATVLKSTWSGFWLQSPAWWSDTGVGWSGITPLVGDVTGDNKADYIFAANDNGTGIKVYVAASSGSGFGAPSEWWSGPGWSYANSKFSLGDVDKNGAADLVVTTIPVGGGSAAYVLLSTWSGFWQQPAWWSDSGTGWSGITPLVGDVTADGKADYIFMANDNGNGIKAYVAASSGSGFGTPSVWWNGSGWSYANSKFSLGDVDNNGAKDVVVTTIPTGGGAAAYPLLSTWSGFWQQSAWWTDSGTGWSGITPFTGDVTGDSKADTSGSRTTTARPPRPMSASRTGAAASAPPRCGGTAPAGATAASRPT
jgi:hypothetical protein